jgi:hypothetical protein
VETRTYYFALLDEAGLENRQPARFTLRLVPDEPPRVRMKLPGAGELITPEAVLPIEIESVDTYGLAGTELVYQIVRENVEGGRAALPGFRPGVKTFRTRLDWPVSSVGLAAGQTLTLVAQAIDFDDVSGPNLGRSPEATLRVVTAAELRGEFARREREQRTILESLIDSQENLRRELLSAPARVRNGADVGTMADDLGTLERQQRSIAGSVNAIRRQFESILAEYRVNRIETPEDRARIAERIVTPLNRLGARDLVAATDAIRQWSRDGSAQRAALIDVQQAALLSEMRSVLASMIQWESYQDVVNVLREIVRLQRELRAETEEALQRQADDVFED